MPEERIPTGPDVERSPDGLVRVDAPETQARIYVKPPRPYLQRFDRMILGPIQLAYKQGVRGLSAREETGLRNRFRQMLLDSIRRGPAWSLTDRPDEGVLAVRVAVVEIDMSTRDQMSNTSNISFRRANGGAVLIIELYDSATRKPLFRFIERRTLPSGTYSGHGIDQRRLALTFDRFADDLGASLRNHYAIIREIERRELERARVIMIPTEESLASIEPPAAE